MALFRFSPAKKPARGGKMIFPAPRKKAKVIKPRPITSKVDKDLFTANLIAAARIMKVSFGN
ncbi:hypothetical protein GCM10022421_14090 [Oceanisphaera sediminis]|uniref:Uncharacterized protein n=1 Tax=Oceanisphaera sediminis TaxID=981381 RepID=A0ABP7DUR3_9GAMM